MDPQAALDGAERALQAGELANAQQFLNNYREWRSRGGFEPAGGDAQFDALSKRMRELRTTRRGVVFDTRPYYTSHLKEPRGTGSWAFAFGSRDAEPWFAPLNTYPNAKRAARAQAVLRGCATVYVLP